MESDHHREQERHAETAPYSVLQALLEAGASMEALVLGDVRGYGPYFGKTDHIAAPGPFDPQIVEDEIGMPGDLDFADASKDIVIASGWHDRVQWFRWSLQEVIRVCRPGGHCIFVMPVDGETALALVPSSSSNPTDRLRAGVRKLLGRAKSPQKYPSIFAVLEELGVRLLANHLQAALGGKVDEVVTLAEGLTASARYLGGDGLMTLVCEKLKQPFHEDERLSERALLDSAILRDNSIEISRLERWREVTSVPDEGATPLDLTTCLRPLVLSPHPDDEVIGLGGTIAKLRDAGGRATVVQVTNGSTSESLYGQTEALRRSIRLSEARRVSRRLGADLICWDDIDDNLHPPFDALGDRLLHCLETIRPDSVFVPFINDPHPDHLAVNAILYRALREFSGRSEILVNSYEVWTFCPRNRFVDVTEVKGEMLDALAIYRTALRTVNYVRTSTWLTAWHGMQIKGRPCHCEAFYQQSADDYLYSSQAILERLV